MADSAIHISTCQCACHSPGWLGMYPQKECICDCSKLNKKQDISQENISRLKEFFTEESQNKIDNEIEQDERIYEKKPHKCPLCKGSGESKTHSFKVEGKSTIYPAPCKPCKGEGIVWG